MSFYGFSRSTECPDCRTIFHQTKRVYLNVSATDNSPKKSSHQSARIKKLEKLNALNRQIYADLATAAQAKTHENAVLGQTVNELRRLRLLDAGNHKIETRNLENVLNYQRYQYRHLQNLAREKDRTINELSAVLRLKALERRNEKSQMDQMRTENAALIGQITLFNQFVGAMNLSHEFEQMTKQSLAQNLVRQ